ncbi:MAG: general secretion pathway protein GspB [Burkholderiales bacterium]|nr:general secretion pathway protein GspB [Burkholderiales bacterium]
MSYILDALKKAERERQRGAVPTISVDLAEPLPAKRTPYGLYIGLAAGLLVLGVAIGAYRPLGRAAASASSATAVTPAAAPRPAPALVLERPAVRAITRPVAPAVEKQVVQPATPTTAQQQSASVALPVAGPARAVPAATASPEAKSVEPVESQPWALADLPLNLQQEIPAMNVMFHAYSSDPAQRLVEVNGKPMHEGDSLSAGLKLEKITQDGMVFSYKGYRFRTGVR